MNSKVYFIVIAIYFLQLSMSKYFKIFINNFFFDRFDEPNRVGALTPASLPKQPWSGEQTFTVSGFPTSKNAERIGKLPRQTIIDECLKQLDEMFANGVGQKLANNREMDEELDV